MTLLLCHCSVSGMIGMEAPPSATKRRKGRRRVRFDRDSIVLGAQTRVGARDRTDRFAVIATRSSTSRPDGVRLSICNWDRISVNSSFAFYIHEIVRCMSSIRVQAPNICVYTRISWIQSSLSPCATRTKKRCDWLNRNGESP